jgi:3-deoxy-D-manno-octulosonate 8-phosphate phosphatase (KDO 8-P phosphatase)
MMTDEELFMRAKNVKVLILDVDGVLTDGSIIYDAADMEIKAFNVKDGHGLKLIQRNGVQIAFITGRESEVVNRRAKELQIEHVYQKAIDKLAAYEDLKAKLSSQGLKDENFAYVGDDLLDIPIAKRVGFSAAVADANDELKKHSLYITKADGGRGAVREVCEIILKSKGLWGEVLKKYDR